MYYELVSWINWPGILTPDFNETQMTVWLTAHDVTRAILHTFCRYILCIVYLLTCKDQSAVYKQQTLGSLIFFFRTFQQTMMDDDGKINTRGCNSAVSSSKTASLDEAVTWLMWFSFILNSKSNQRRPRHVRLVNFKSWCLWLYFIVWFKMMLFWTHWSKKHSTLRAWQHAKCFK